MIKILLCTTCIVATSSFAFAQKITPNHVFQVAANINVTVDKMHEVNLSKAPTGNLESQPRKPRHVLQAAQEVDAKVQTLRYLNGLSPKRIEPIPVRNVTPGDVKLKVDQILSDLTDVLSAFGIDGSLSNSAVPNGKSPTDVYNELSAVSASLDKLGLPAIVPNDVYRIAQTLISDLEILANHNGITIPTQTTDFKGKKPADVYEEAKHLLMELKSLSDENPNYQVAGGIVFPTFKSGNISPADVLKILNTTLAEVGAMKVSAGTIKETQLAELEGGKTPSDVFAALAHARNIVSTLN